MVRFTPMKERMMMSVSTLLSGYWLVSSLTSVSTAIICVTIISVCIVEGYKHDFSSLQNG